MVVAKFETTTQFFMHHYTGNCGVMRDDEII